jgi:hypothetical protein
MSRAERQIAALELALREARAERSDALGRLQDERSAIQEAMRLHPDCPTCAALRVSLDAARRTIDAMAAEAKP